MTNLSETLINNKRNWKAQTFPYEYFIPDDSKSCLYCLTDKEAELLRGLLEPVAWKTRWWVEDDSNTVDTDAITQFRDDMIRRLMMPCGCDDEGTIFQWTTNGHYQKSTDGGATWEDAPQSDPHNGITRFPPFLPPDTLDDTCTYADSIVNLVKTGFVDALADGSDYATVVGALEAVLTTIFVGLLPTGIGAIIVAVAGAVIILIVTLGVPALRAAMTTGVWDRFRCNLKNHMESDGSFTEAEKDAVWSQIIVDESGLAAIFLQAFVATAGAVGLTNAARSGNGASDAECCPSCNTDNWAITIFHSLPVGVLIGAGTNYVDVQTGSHPDFGGGQFAQITMPASGDCCTYDHTEVLSGGTILSTSGILCGDPLWPTSEVHGFSAPASINTFRIVSDTVATCRIHFV